jgi:chemotaxis response regulator CheB
MHVGGASALGSILNRCGAMPVVEACEGEKIERGRAYVAPSDKHLLLNIPTRWSGRSGSRFALSMNALPFMKRLPSNSGG